MKVPRLDLSKVKRDSEEDGEDDEGENEHDEEGKDQNVTYQQYLKFLENESRFEEMGEAS